MSRFHFHHPAGEGCDAARSMVEGARLLVQQRVAEMVAGGPPPVLVRRCAACGTGADQALPPGIELVEPEGDDRLYLTDASGRWRAVVVLGLHLGWGAAVEAGALPTMRLDAADLVLDPGRWPVRGDGLHPLACQVCAEREEREREVERRQEAWRMEWVRERARTREVLERLCAEHGLFPGGNGYFAAPYVCFRCHAPTVVYRWRGHEPQEPDAPPEPRPRTLQWRYTQQLGDSYWANTCVACGVVQGDHYLYRDPDGLFYRGHHAPPGFLGRSGVASAPP